MTTAHRTRLTLSALAGATSLIAIATPAHAQSVCVETVGTFNCTDGTATATGSFTGTGAVMAATPEGLALNSTGDLNVVANGSVNTSSAFGPSVFANANGDLTFGAGTGAPIDIVSTGGKSAVVLNSATGSVNATVGSLSSVSNSFLNFTAQTSAENSASLTTGSISNTAIPGTFLTGGALVFSNNGPATLVTNGDITAAGDVPVGALVVTPNDDANVTVNGNVTVTGTQSGTGIATLGANATTNVTGTVTVTAPLASGPFSGSSGIVTTALTGLSSTTCGDVNVTGNSVVGVTGVGNDVYIRCGNITTNGDGGIGVSATAANSIDAIVGDVSTNGIAAHGLALTAPGTISVGTGDISTAGDGSVGLFVLGGTGNVTATTGNVTTLGAGSDGVDILTTTGDITVTTGNISATGAGSLGLFTVSTDGNQLIKTGSVTADDDGINANAAGTGDITIQAAGPVVSTNGIGITALGTTGDIMVDASGANGALGGINVLDSGVGSVTVYARNGTVTSTGGNAVQLATLGTATTGIAAGATVRGQNGFDAINTNGALGNFVNVSGTLNAGNAAGYAVNASGGSTIVNILPTGSVSGPVSLTASNDRINNGGSLTLTRTSDFGLGDDTLANLQTGTLHLDQGASIVGLETLINGGNAIAVGTTDFGGAIFNNANPGMITVVGGPATLANVTVLNNAGMITMVDGATNDTLTVGGDYFGAGSGRLALDVAGNLASADKLIVNGNISGVTTVSLNRVGGAMYNPTGALIVDGTGTVSNGTFVLNPADVQAGFLNYGLKQSGNDTFVISTLDNSVTDLAFVGTMGRDLWYQSFDAYHDAIMGRHAGATATGHPIGIWGQLYGSRDKYGDDGQTATIGGQTVTYSNRMKTERRGGQAGLEYRGPGFVLGITGGYEWARTEEQPVASRIGAEGHNYGAYALFGMQNGIYGGVMYKRDEFKVRFDNGLRSVGFRNKAHSDGVDGELGFRGTSQSFAFDLNAGLSYVKTHIDPWNDYGLDFSWDNNKSLRGRLGAQVILPQAFGAFVGAKVFHEFKDDGALLIRNAALVGDVPLVDRGTWVRAEAGLNGSGTNGVILTVWGDFGDTKGFGGRVGFRF